MGRPVDYWQAAKTMKQDRFAATYPFLFLLGTNVLTRPARGSQTTLPVLPDFETLTRRPSLLPKAHESMVQVFAVKKIHSTFTDMITLGRSSNNDIVVSDTQVSKFHAYFRALSGEMHLFDGGSANGTFVGRMRLEPKGDGVPVRPGDLLRFGGLYLELLDAAACHERLNQLASVLDSL
jgi:hypothetical protein